jgi:hypothetical protein
MVQQTKVTDRNGAVGTESQGLAKDLGAFANDVLTLTELQSQLLVADAREFGSRATVPSVALIAGLILGMACAPIALVTVALGLVHFLELSHFTALLIVVVAGLISSLLMSIIGWMQIRKRAAVLGRSRDELMRNLHWIKRVIASSRSH